MNTYPIFVSSSDSYSDIWPVFFDMFHRFWPEYNGCVYLNTETKSITHDSLNIVCTQVGKFDSFGKMFRAGLNTIDSDVVLLIMIDYLFMDKVNVSKLDDYFDFFTKNNLDSLCLVHQHYPNVIDSDHPDIVYVIPPASRIMFSYQVAFWNKSMLYNMALPHENPWMSEWFGSLRAEKMKIKLANIKKEVDWPIFYDLRGCLHQGEWLDNAVEFLKSIDYKVDFAKRGYYVDGYSTLSFRLKLKIKIWSTGIKGSYWDLLFRKYN